MKFRQLRKKNFNEYLGVKELIRRPRKMNIQKIVNQIKKTTNLIALYSSKKQNLISVLTPSKNRLKSDSDCAMKSSCRKSEKLKVLVLIRSNTSRAPPWCIVILNPDEVWVKNLRYETLRPG
jgi:hypothetical protein